MGKKLDEVLAQPEPPKMSRAQLENLKKSQVKSVSHYVPRNERRCVSEKQVETEIINYLKSVGAWVVKFHPVRVVGSKTDARVLGNRAGVPDLLVCYQGHFLAIEVKKPLPGAKISPNQQREIASIQKAKGMTLVAHCVNQVRMMIKQIDERSSHDDGSLF